MPLDELVIISGPHHAGTFQVAEDSLLLVFVAVYPDIEQGFFKLLADQQQLSQFLARLWRRLVSEWPS